MRVGGDDVIMGLLNAPYTGLSLEFGHSDQNKSRVPLDSAHLRYCMKADRERNAHVTSSDTAHSKAIHHKNNPLAAAKLAKCGWVWVVGDPFCAATPTFYKPTVLRAL